MAATDTDRVLLQRSQSGDSAAFEAVMLRHQASVYRFLLTLTDDDAEAQDALQECFLAAWRSAGTFAGDSSARGWLLTIARNVVRRSHRRRAGEPSSFEPLEALGAEAGWGVAPRVDLERLHVRAVLQRALASLPPEERQVLTLRDLEGFSGNEVAEMLSITVPAMKSRLHRARLRVVAQLKRIHDVGA